VFFKMAVIVHDDMPIDQALKMLWREANREDIPNVLQKTRYRIPKTATKHEFEKQWLKMKRRRRSANRKLTQKGRRIITNN
jgi:ribosomal protein S21